MHNPNFRFSPLRQLYGGRYYDLHPHAFLERTIRDQGIWMPFKSNLSDIEGGWEDFGVKFQEGGGAAVNERYMNAHG